MMVLVTGAVSRTNPLYTTVNASVNAAALTKPSRARTKITSAKAGGIQERSRTIRNASTV
jgi:hypothetical protein